MVERMKHDDDGRGGLVPVGDIPIDALGSAFSVSPHPSSTRAGCPRARRVLRWWGIEGAEGKVPESAREATFRAVDPLCLDPRPLHVRARRGSTAKPGLVGLRLSLARPSAQRGLSQECPPSSTPASPPAVEPPQVILVVLSWRVNDRVAVRSACRPRRQSRLAGTLDNWRAGRSCCCWI